MLRTLTNIGPQGKDLRPVDMRKSRDRVWEEFNKRYGRLINVHNAINQRISQGNRLREGVSIITASTELTVSIPNEESDRLRRRNRAEREYQHAHVDDNSLPTANPPHCTFYIFLRSNHPAVLINL